MSVRRHALVALALSLSACSGGDADRPAGDGALDRPISDSAATGAPGTPGAGGADQPAPAAGPGAGAPGAEGAEGRVATEIRVTIKGGPHAGSYEARPAATTCSYGQAGEGAWANQYSDAEKAEGLRSLQLIVPDAAGAANGTDRFTLTADFTPLLDGQEHTINTVARPGVGSGRVTVETRAGGTVAAFEGTTADGVGIEGTVRCIEMLRVR
jgi:hypothetical protein